MPLIPFDPRPTVAPAGASGVFLDARAATPDKFGALEAQATAGIGHALDHAGDVAAEHAIKFQQQQNVTNVDDVYNNGFSPAFRDLYQKYYSLQGKDAVDQMPDFIKQMEDVRQGVHDTLPNDEQKRLFDGISRRRVQAELDGMSRYADQQNKAWRAQTFDATLSNYSTQAADKYNDEQSFGMALGSARATIEQYGQATGASPEWGRAKMAEFTSSAMTSRVQRAMLDDPVGALALYRANAHDIAADKRAVLEHQLRTAVLPVEAKRAAETVIRGVVPPNLDQALTIVGEPLINAVVAAESGGNPDAVSPKGAKGAMQVMGGTNTDPGFGVAPARDDSKEERVRVGKDYLGAMLGRYSGNQTLALAAYNAGPGNVDKWVKTLGDPSKGEISDADFAAKIPYKETREYVAKVNTAAPQGATVPTSSRDTRAQLTSWIPNAEKMAEAIRPGDPVFRDMVVAQVKGYVNTIVAAQEGVQRQAHDTLMKVAIGPDKPMTIDQLLEAPETRQAWAVTDPNSQRGIIALLDHNAKTAQGVPIRTDPNVFDALFKAVHLPDNDPNKIRQPGQIAPYFAHGLSKTDYDWLKREIDQNQTADGQRLNDTRNNFLSGVKAQFTQSTILKTDPKGDEDFYKYRTFVLEQERKAREAGTDTYALFNPDAKEYLGKQIPGFQRSLEQKLRDFSASMGGPARTLPPEQQRRPGETAEQYLARTGSK